MERNILLSEPSKKEITQQTLITYANSYQLLIDLRSYCNLNKSQGASLLGIDRTTLRRYENQKRDMTHLNFCSYVSAYYLYAISNQIPLPIEIETVCHFFMKKSAESKQK